jgi:hypothetical protein
LPNVKKVRKRNGDDRPYYYQGIGYGKGDIKDFFDD